MVADIGREFHITKYIPGRLGTERSAQNDDADDVDDDDGAR